MSIKYELSLWRDYPSARGIDEEKVLILAATDMEDGFRASDIILNLEYTGAHTLEFQIQAKHIEHGELINNPNADKVINGSKIKLYREEKWYDAYDTITDEIDENGNVIIHGAWKTGRWYDFIVKKKTKSRNKKGIVYKYVCENAFIKELSKTGFNLEFSKDSIDPTINGMGTVHTLTEKTLSGTSWNYLKTETFQDYQEKMNGHTGEVDKIPVSTDQIELIKSESRYGYCYKINVDASEFDTIKEILPRDIDDTYYCGKELNGDFYYYKSKIDKDKDIKTKYILGYEKTNIITSYANKIIVQDCGEVVGEKTNATLFDTEAGWEVEDEQDYITITTDQKDNGELKYYLRLNCFNYNAKFINTSYQDTKIDAGEILAFKIADNGNNSIVNFCIEDYNLETKQRELVLELPDISLNMGNSSYDNTYWITCPKEIKHPHFSIISPDGGTIDLSVFYLYKLTGYNIKYKDVLYNAIYDTSGDVGLIKNLSVTLEGNTINLQDNKVNETTPFWLPFGAPAAEGYKQGYNIYLCEIFINGEYKTFYLPIINAEKIISYNVDKRRMIDTKQSNRFSILETISKTFYCFTKIIVKHDETGRVSRDINGKLEKHITMASSLGNNQFHGFNYGVNLDTVGKEADSENLVTKMYINDIDNEFSDNGVVSIIDSSYNTLGEKFIYNFAYFIQMGVLDSTTFLKKYSAMGDVVSNCNKKLKELSEEYLALKNEKDKLENLNYTYLTINKALKSSVDKMLKFIKWTDVKDIVVELSGADFTEIELEEATSFPTLNLSIINEALCAWFEIENANFTYELLAAIITETADDYGVIGPELSYEEVLNNIKIIFSYQTKYNNYEEKMAVNKTSLQIINAKIALYEESITNEIDIKTKAINYFEKIYIDYIIEGVWDGGDYIDANTYYLDATRALSVSCFPKAEYNVGSVDISKACNPEDPTDTQWGEDFIYDVGDTTQIRDTELFGETEEKSMIASKKIYVDQNKQDNITLQNYETRFEDLFQSIAAAVTTLNLNENIYNRAANFTSDGVIDTSILQKSFDANKSLIMNTNNNKVSWDQYGISVKNVDDNGELVRIISGGILLSKDGGNTYTTGLTADGINASLITAGQIDTSKIVIRSAETPNYIWDICGITAYDTTVNHDISTGNNTKSKNIVRFDQFGIYMTEQGDLFKGKWWNGTSGDNATFIGDNSIFSLTRKGLIINGINGAIGLNTIDSTFTSKDVNGNLRVKMGYIRTEDNSSIHGLDIYDGALRIYGKSYNDIINYDDNDEASIYFEDSNMYINGILKRNSFYTNTSFHDVYKTTTSLIDTKLLSTGTASGHVVGFGITSQVRKENGDLSNIQDCSYYFGRFVPYGALIVTPNIFINQVENAQYEIRTISSSFIIEAVDDKTNTSGCSQIFMRTEPTRGRINIGVYANKYYLPNVEIAMDSGQGSNGPRGKLEGTWLLNSASIATTSDENKKNSYGFIPDKYSILFDNLKPSIYKYNNGTSDRYHIGFIAQEVNLALEEATINTNDFAGLVISDPGTDEEQWYIRYEEFTALNTYEIQKLKVRITELETIVAQLTSSN